MPSEICITGSETSLAALESRFAAPELQNFLHEVRVDHLNESPENICAFVKRHAHRTLATLRSQGQGGRFSGTPRERDAWLVRLAEAGPAVLDVESEATDAMLHALQERCSSQLLLSHHDFAACPHNVGELAARFAARPADAVKLAVTVSDATELTSLLEARKEIEKPHQLIGMGFAGLLSRARYLHFGSLWTYVGAREGIAPGQLDWNTARLWGLPEAARAPFLCVVGGEQIAHSPGPRVYNALFRQRGLPWSYIPVVSQKGAEAFSLVRRLGALGASVTMPHKEAAFSFGIPDEVALAAQAANTLRWDGDACRCTITDVEGVELPLRAAGVNPGSLVLILGAGGAARAAWLACKKLRLRVVVAARNPEKARTTWPKDVAFIPWEQRGACAADTIINTTPVTNDTLWPLDLPLRARVVLDAAIAPAMTPLLNRARAAGAMALSPFEMWSVQGAAQMRWLTGLDVDGETLAELRTEKQF